MPHLEVLAVHTFADLPTEDAGLKALAVLLQAARLLAVTALGVAHSSISRTLSLISRLDHKKRKQAP
jgi:hypothetical protein